MDRPRGDRFSDRPAGGGRFTDRPGDGSGFSDRPGDGGGRHGRMPSRWSSGSPNGPHPRYPRGGGEGFSGGGGRGGRHHPYREPPQDFPGDGTGFRDGPGGGGGGAGFEPPMPMGGQKRGFHGRGGSPEYPDWSKFVKLFIGSVPRTATEEDIRPLFEEHGDVIEVALIKDKRTGQQQGPLRATER